MIWVIHKPNGEIVGAAADKGWAEMAAEGDLAVIEHSEEIDVREYHVVDGVVVRKDQAVIDAEVYARDYDEASRRVRFERSRRLMKSDWTQAPDAPVDAAAWAAYRQALRDIPQQAGFPNNITWPEAPK